MRICVFSPDVEPLARPAWRVRLEAQLGADHQVQLLTNSWAEIPPESDVYVTGATKRLGMRLSRRILGHVPGRGAAWRAAIAEPVVRAVGDELLEGLRATDPDLVVSLHAGWTECFRRRHVPWPCVTLGDPVPFVDTTWRRYDPTAKVSIVLPTYNGVRYLAESIQSCLAQTHRSLELIVVDDGSCDQVRAVVGEFADPRLSVVRHPENRGLPCALNTGFERATGEFCTWTSDDNVYEADALERMLRFLQNHPTVDFVYAESYRSDESAPAGEPHHREVMRPRPPESLADDNYIGACFLYKRRVQQELGEYNPEATLAEDYDYWVRVHQRFVMQRLFAPLYTYRFHSASLTSLHTPETVARTVQWVKHAHGIGGRP